MLCESDFPDQPATSAAVVVGLASMWMIFWELDVCSRSPTKSSRPVGKGVSVCEGGMRPNRWSTVVRAWVTTMKVRNSHRKIKTKKLKPIKLDKHPGLGDH